MTISRGFLAFSLLMGVCRFAEAGTIAAISDTLQLGFGPAIFSHYPSPNDTLGGQFGEESWTTTQTYTNVSITVPLSLFASTGTYHGAAYLTNSIGPGTTTALANTSFVGSNALPQTVQLFSGLTLGPGTYYLTIAGLDLVTNPVPGFVWSYGLTSDATFQSVTAPGVTIGQGHISCNFPVSSTCGVNDLNYAFPPGSTFRGQVVSSASYLQFSVVGDPVPEPSTLCLLAIGFLILGWLKIARASLG